ncbi:MULTISPECIES: SdpI family protein [Tsukamurella]|uniref:SdpI family protein n=1 Tax=Tsukamurella columbiensis TaxID=128509 RepID=A0ABX1LK72_9ACTN|nr:MULTISPECIES: SdpI family protein [Tsukamurella]NMD57877.1 SdpI family protein [Tsukamurella columbiensis]
MFVLVVILALAAVAAVIVGAAGLAGRLPENGFVGVRTEQTLSDPLLWRTANRVAGPSLVAAGVIFGAGALVGLAMDAPWSFVAAGVAVIAGVLLAGFGALQGARAASIQARLQMPDATCCSADEPGAQCGDGAPSDDPAADCGVTGGCGACALKGMCDHEARTA